VGEQQRQDRHREPARQDPPIRRGSRTPSGLGQSTHPTRPAIAQPSPQQLLQDDEEADDANDIDEQGAA